MHITLTKDYSVRADTTLLGYQGETNSRKITFSGLVVDGCDLYKLQILYSDGKVYELPIQDEVVTISGSILREIGYVSCQLLGYSVSGSDYTIVFKSNIFELEIKEAIDGEVAPIPPYEEAAGALEKVLAGVEAAKGYAESAGTAADRAENARQQAVTAQNNAKISADLAASAAQQTTADKNITAGYAQTAKTNADSTAADRQAVTDMAAQVTADKATVADNAAQVATDRTAAETAAQTAQAVADSLPDDYVTAVEKIAENTAEIANVKLTDKELQRRVDALYDMGNGVTHQFETDTDTAYQKTVPTGAKLMSVKSVGGRSVVFNQLADAVNVVDETVDAGFYYAETKFRSNRPKWAKGHKYFVKFYAKSDVEPFSITIGYSNAENLSFGKDGQTFANRTNGWQTLFYTPSDSLIDDWPYIALRPVRYFEQTQFVYSVNSLMIVDLTQMFGSGNEPASVEEFEKMFPADYYPYNAGEIVSAGTEEVVEQGKNIFDYTNEIYHGQNVSKVENGVIYTKGSTTTVLNIPTIIGNKYTLSFKVKASVTNRDGLQWSLQKGKNTIYANDSSMIQVKVGFNANTEYQAVATFVADTDFVSLCTIVGMVYDIQLELGDTATDYSPFYQTEYPIPEAIKALPGYGWSAGTAKNWVDYENKQYHQCVSAVDLGTLDWTYSNIFGTGQNGFSAGAQNDTYNMKSYPAATMPNCVCTKYPAITASEQSISGSCGISIYNGWNLPTAVKVIAFDSNYTDAAAFKQAMQGVILYYELANPIITDISTLIDDDFLRNISVEAGGSITFKNGNGDSYQIPVPSEEEYIVKLSEVGGTT